MAINQDLPIPARSPTRTRSIDLGKALKMRLQGNTLDEIGKVLGHTRQSIHRCLQNFEPLLTSLQPGTLTAYAEERSNLLSAIELRMTASLADEQAIQKSSLRDRAVTLGIITDKRRLEAGQSTSNTMLLGKLIVQAELKLGSSSPGSQPAAGPLLEAETKPVRGKFRRQKQK